MRMAAAPLEDKSSQFIRRIGRYDSVRRNWLQTGEFSPGESGSHPPEPPTESSVNRHEREHGHSGPMTAESTHPLATGDRVRSVSRALALLDALAMSPEGQ